jgi:hypothetical protein
VPTKTERLDSGVSGHLRKDVECVRERDDD